MADRFPSLDDIDAGQNEVRDGGDTDGGDFLARERAALGDDAELFATGNVSKQATIEDGDDDLLGGDFSGGAQQASTVQQDDFDTFESSFPAVDTTNDNIGPGGTITGSTLPYQPPTTTYNSGYTAANTTEDTEPIRAWREKRNADLARRDEASAQKKEETTNTARKDIDSFYESYNRKVDRQKAQTAKEAEEFLAKREDTTSGGTAWERIAKLADLHGGKSRSGDGASKQRMRELMLDLAKDSNAPGAKVSID